MLPPSSPRQTASDDTPSGQAPTWEDALASRTFTADLTTTRNAFADTEHVQSDLVKEGSLKGEPLVTIAIPTFKRFDYLFETVASVMNQTFERDYEIVVVDNDPESRTFEALLERFPALNDLRFRYFVNRENLGLFGNWNRCIAVARGEWVMVLNDDDMLDPTCLDMLFAEIDRRPGTDAIASRKRFLNEPVPVEKGGDVLGDMPASTGRSWRESARDLFPAGSVARDVLKLPLTAYRSVRSLMRQVSLRYKFHHWYGANASRPIPANTFFWGPVLGNGAGFLFRTAHAKAIGGYDPENGSAADVWFSARFAERFHLRQSRFRAATVRIASNVSMKPAVSMSVLEGCHGIQKALLASGAAPSSWRSIAPLVMERMRREFEVGFALNLPKQDAERLLDLKLPKDRPRLLAAVRYFCGGSYPDAL